MSVNLFEEYVNGMESQEENPISRYGLKDIQIETWDGEILDAGNTEVEIDQEARRTIKEAYAGLMSFSTSAFPTPVWVRICATCGGFFISQNWRAEHCDECDECGEVDEE